MTKAKVSVEYVELKAKDLEKDIAVDEGRLEDMYNLYKRNAMNTEERRASHILLTTGATEDKSRDVVMARMQELQKKLEAGESFEDLARENSEDPGSAAQGGDLDWVARGQMVEPFEDALFALNKGEISGIVETQFGLHLIRLDDIRAPEFASFEEKRAELERELKQEVVSSMFYDVSENLAVTAYENPDSLDMVVDVLNIPVQQTEMFTRHNGEGIAANAKFREAAFSEAVLQGGSNSDIIEIAPDHVAVLRVLKNEPAARQPLSEVESNIRSIIELKRAYENTLAAAQQAKDKVANGETLESVLWEGQSVQMYTGIKRYQTGEPGAEVIQTIFSMSDPASGGISVENVNLPTGDVAIVVLDKVHKPVDIAEDSLNRVKQQRKSDVASAEFEYALTSLQDAAEIERNSAILQ
jgi:peptidyl-prolyl cis-trans isomerase D